MDDINERRYLRAKLLALAAAVAFLVSCGLTSLARAEDMNDVRGTRHGCIDVTSTGGWDTVTSDLMENSTSGAVLAASLYWTEVLIHGGSAAVYLCLNSKTNCGTGTANKLSVATGATVSIPLRGIAPASASGVQSIAVYSGIGETFQVCGHFRVSP